MKPFRLHLLAALFACSGMTLWVPIDVQAQGTEDDAGAKVLDRPVSRRVMKTIIGSEVQSLERRNIGKITELMVDSSRNQVAYLVVDRPDQRRLIMLPFQLLRVREDDRLMITVAHDKLSAKRGFSSDDWPDVDDESWARKLHQEFGLTPYWELAGAPAANAKEANTIDDKQKAGPNFNTRTKWVNRASQMIGLPVKNAAGQTLGNVNDLFLDIRQGRGHIVYAILKDLPTDELKDRMALVPFSAMQPIPQGKEFRVEAKVEDLTVASLTEADFERTGDPQWHRRVHQAFQREPYWTTFGIPADGNGAAGDLDPIWQPGSAYMKNFDLQRSRRFTGTVLTTSEFQAGEGAVGKLVVITSDEDQRRYTIHLGPASFFEGAAAKLKLEPGDQVVIRGSRGVFNNQELYLADQVAMIKQLRDSSGKPLFHDLDATKKQKDVERD